MAKPGAVRRILGPLLGGRDDGDPDGRAARSVHPLSKTERDRVTLLAVVFHDEDAANLDRILASTNWWLQRVTSCGEAVSLLNEQIFPVVLYDRDTPGQEWYEAVRELGHARHPAAIVLSSRVCDAFLWEEIIQQGGFDVISKPFDPVQVVRTLNFALSHWKTEWMRRTRDQLDARSAAGSSWPAA